MTNNRDEFSEITKRILAERVAWRCSFQGCDLPTIGPHAEKQKSTCLGEAAHITSAAPNGPRYDSTLTSEQRRDISNGIWMCKPHARLIDVDKDNYAEDTLRQWKLLTERRAYEALEQGETPGVLAEPDTLVALGLSVVIKGVWLSGRQNEWRFRCTSFYRGDQTNLRDEISRGVIEFVVVESQGDGRLLSGPIRWENVDGNLELTIPIKDRVPRLDPSTLGSDLALGSNGDIEIFGGNCKLVKGVDNAIQRISIAMGTMVGEVFCRPNTGSLATLYYHKYGDNLKTLGRLMKLELARLATIPVDGCPPPLNSIWRVNKLKILSKNLDGNRLSVKVDLEWCNSQKWTGDVKVYIHKDLKIFSSLARS